VYCPNCGQENAEEAELCRNCSYDLTKIPGSRKNAGFWLRFVAYIIDSVLLGIVGWIVAIPFILTLGDANYSTLVSITFTGIVLYIIFHWLYFALMESSTKQASLGKMVLGLIVTNESGNRISFSKATGRVFAKFLSHYILYIGYVMIAFTKKKQGLHDLIAGTLVVKK
jgi:uncharacterized RDD family membrane protein YckC